MRECVTNLAHVCHRSCASPSPILCESVTDLAKKFKFNAILDVTVVYITISLTLIVVVVVVVVGVVIVVVVDVVVVVCLVVCCC